MGWEAGAGVVSSGSRSQKVWKRAGGIRWWGCGGGVRGTGSDSQGSEQREDSPGETLLS